MERISLIKGDITQIKTDAIVNAANNSLTGGGGVDGAIHKSAGSKLLEECEKLNGCETGEAKITKGYKLFAKFVIHTVGPVWHGGSSNEKLLLANCYRNSLKLAKQHNIKSIAFPTISTGIYGFPIEEATEIAVNEVIKHLQSNKIKIAFVVFNDNAFSVYEKILQTKNKSSVL
ncbi:MAG TPA: O-acetyl-ADP-ribose deacetylase [Bacteroidales bacterium]|nr:O-acetyl-ADP-ribose deacetylase [Bacteroidales bacterium]